MSFIIAFVIVPIIIKLVGYETVIYLQYLDPKVILQNLLYIFIFIGLVYVFRIKKEKKVQFLEAPNLNRFSAIVLVAWVVLFLVLGGLTYRETDTVYGYNYRGIYLDFILSLYDLMIVIALSVANRIKLSSTKLKPLEIIALLCFLIVIVVSGNRGIFIQFIISYVFLTLLKTKNVQLNKNQFKRLFKLKYLSLIVLTALVFVGVGYFRDGYSNFGFETLFRLSEPYWYMSYDHSINYGGDASILVDSIERIAYIFTNTFGGTITGSIEGSDFYIYKYLGIEFVEGRSLPITLFGYGYILNPYFGVLITLIITLILLKLGLKINTFFSKKILWGYEYSVYFATSCLLLYGKSLSGVFQVLIYEKFRDFLFLLALTLLWLTIKKKIII
jgi:hypothetical protein